LVTFEKEVDASVTEEFALKRKIYSICSEQRGVQMLSSVEHLR